MKELFYILGSVLLLVLLSITVVHEAMIKKQLDELYMNNEILSNRISELEKR